MTQFGMGAFDGTDYAVGAKVMAIAAETWDTSGHGTEMTFLQLLLVQRQSQNGCRLILLAIKLWVQLLMQG